MAWGSESRWCFPLLLTDEELSEPANTTTIGQDNSGIEFKRSAGWDNEDRWSFSSLSITTAKEETSKTTETGEVKDTNVGYSFGWGDETRWNYSSSPRVSRTTSKDETRESTETSVYNDTDCGRSFGLGNESRGDSSPCISISFTNAKEEASHTMRECKDNVLNAKRARSSASWGNISGRNISTLRGVSYTSPKADTPKTIERGEENDTNVGESFAWGNESRWSFTSLFAISLTNTKEETSMEEGEDSVPNTNRPGLSARWGDELRWYFTLSCRVSRTTAKEDTSETSDRGVKHNTGDGESFAWGNESRWSFYSSLSIFTNAKGEASKTTGEGEDNLTNSSRSRRSARWGNEARWNIPLVQIEISLITREATSKTTGGIGNNGVYQRNRYDINSIITRVLHVDVSLNVSAFLHIAITLLILAPRIVTHVASDPVHLTQLRQGENATIGFSLQFPHFSSAVPTFILYFESIARPFAINGKLLEQGFKDKSQLERFNVRSVISNHTLFVNLTINSVTVRYDQGVYVLTLTLYGTVDISQLSTRKTIEIVIPPGRASCFITFSEFPNFREIHCHSTCGNKDVSLACFQNSWKLPYKGEIHKDTVTIRGVFWMSPNVPIYCCSHYSDQYVTQDSCTDYQLVPEERKTSPQPAKQPVFTEVRYVESTAGTTNSSCGQKFQAFASMIIYVLAHLFIHHLNAISVA